MKNNQSQILTYNWASLFSVSNSCRLKYTLAMSMYIILITNSTHILGLNNSRVWKNGLAYFELRDWVDIIPDPTTQLLTINNMCIPKRWREWDGDDCHFRPTPGCEPTEFAMSVAWSKYGLVEMTYWRLINYRYLLSPNQTEQSRAGQVIQLEQIGNQTICQVSKWGRGEGGERLRES